MSLALPVATVNAAHNFVSKTMNANLVVLAVAPASDTALFQDGFEAYCEGQSLADMPTVAQERGWWHANRCQGYAETTAFVVSQNKARRTLSDAEIVAEAEEYEGDMEDRAYHASGMW